MKTKKLYILYSVCGHHDVNFEGIYTSKETAKKEFLNYIKENYEIEEGTEDYKNWVEIENDSITCLVDSIKTFVQPYDLNSEISIPDELNEIL